MKRRVALAGAALCVYYAPLQAWDTVVAQRPPVLMASPGLQAGKSKPQACKRNRMRKAAGLSEQSLRSCLAGTGLALWAGSGANTLGFSPGGPVPPHPSEHITLLLSGQTGQACAVVQNPRTWARMAVAPSK